MLSILITSESRYKVSREKIRQTVKKLLTEKNLTDVEVSVSIVGGRKIRELNKNWRGLDKETDVLSFPLEESRGPDGLLRLGDIIVCFPVARSEAAKENMMLDDKIDELVDHGLRHLLGEHHPE